MINAVKRAKHIGIPLVVIPSPYRSVVRHLVEYVEGLRLVLPGSLSPWSYPRQYRKNGGNIYCTTRPCSTSELHFFFKPNAVVTTVPFLLGHAYRLRDLIEHDDQIGERSPEPLEESAAGRVEAA